MDNLASKDVRKEQIVLLRFEKELARLAGVVAGMSATAASASTKIGSEATSGAYDQIRQALVSLADVTSSVHAQLEATVAAAGLRALEVNGVPKEPPSEVVRFILGLG